MTDVHFIVKESPEGGFSARAVGQDIFTEADTMPQLHTMLRDAVHCHYEKGQAPRLIRMHITREEVLRLPRDTSGADLDPYAARRLDAVGKHHAMSRDALLQRLFD